MEEAEKLKECIINPVAPGKCIEMHEKENFERFAEDFPDAILVHQTGKLMFINSAGMKLFGRKLKGNIIGKSLADLLNSKYGKDERRKFEQFLGFASFNNYSQERFVNTDGEELFLEVIAVPFYFRGVQSVKSVLRNVTKFKLSEGQLQYRLTLEEALAEASSKFVTSKEVDFNSVLEVLGKAIKADRASMFSFDKDVKSFSKTHEWCAARVKPNTTLFQNMGTEQFKWAMDKLQKEEILIIPDAEALTKKADNEKNLIRSYGGRSYVAVPLKTRNGKLAGVLAFIDEKHPRDWADEDVRLLKIASKLISGVFDRRRTEEALVESEEKYTQLTQSAFEGIVIHDEGIILDVNNRILEMLDCKRSEVIGKPIADFIAPGSKTKMAKNVMSSDELKYEAVGLRKDGTEIHVEVVSRPIRYNGRTVRIGAARDLTERKKMEEELFKSQKLESIAVLAGGIAHDFNNIMTVVLGNLNLAKSVSKPGDPIYESLDEAEKAAFRAEDLTYQLLTFSKGGAPIKNPGHLQDLIVDTAEFVLRGSGIKAEYDIPVDLWAAEIDKGQISQVVHNLVLNAVHAMPDEGVIHIRANNCVLQKTDNVPLNPGKYVKISIQDHGTGIDENNLHIIFDPYFTTKENGNGLGLTTSYRIIKKHNGFMDVISAINKGSTFVIYLPATEKNANKQEQVPNKIVKRNGSVLVMDDEELVRKITCKLLEREGYKTSQATDGREAIRKYSDAKKSGKPFDVIIMDLTIPGGLGGEKAMAKLRATDPGVKAIICTGYARNPITKNYKAYGFNDVIIKPFKPETLLHTLNKVLDSGK